MNFEVFIFKWSKMLSCFILSKNLFKMLHLPNCYRPQTKFWARYCFYTCVSFCSQEEWWVGVCIRGVCLHGPVGVCIEGGLGSASRWGSALGALPNLPATSDTKGYSKLVGYWNAFFLILSFQTMKNSAL